MLPSDFLFYRKSRFDIIVALRGDTPPSAGVVIGLLVYCAIVALRGDTPPTAGIPNNSTPTHPTPSKFRYLGGGVPQWCFSTTPPRTHSTPRGDTPPSAGMVIGLLEYYANSGSPWGYAAYGGHP